MKISLTQHGPDQTFEGEPAPAIPTGAASLVGYPRNPMAALQVRDVPVLDIDVLPPENTTG